MKKIALLLIASIAFFSCQEHEEVIFDPATGQTGLAFQETSKSITVPVATPISSSIAIETTTLSDTDRTFNVNVDTEASDLPVASYSLGTITIPANSFSGTFNVDFNSTDLADFVQYTLRVTIDVPEGVAVLTPTGDSVNFTVVKEVICNDFTLDIVEDQYGSETTWDIVDDATGMVVQSGGPFTDGNDGNLNSFAFTLADGCYTFTIYDAFGDGICCAWGNGSYSLDCTIINYASGGSFGASESTQFCVNQ